MNAIECLNNVERLIEELNTPGNIVDYERMQYKGWSLKKVFVIRTICEECGIFDWWSETLSLSQLNQMKTFLKQAIQLGFTGYVCFKVGAHHCSHGMWAYKNESDDNYSPDGDVLYHSFRSGDNYFDMCIDDEWMHDKYSTDENSCPDFTLKQIKAELKK